MNEKCEFLRLFCALHLNKRYVLVHGKWNRLVTCKQCNVHFHR